MTATVMIGMIRMPKATRQLVSQAMRPVMAAPKTAPYRSALLWKANTLGRTSGV